MIKYGLKHMSSKPMAWSNGLFKDKQTNKKQTSNLRTPTPRLGWEVRTREFPEKAGQPGVYRSAETRRPVSINWR